MPDGFVSFRDLNQAPAKTPEPSVGSGFVSFRELAGETSIQSPSRTRRFVGGVGEMLNPVTIAKGLAQAVSHPVETGGALLRAQGEQLGKAREALGEGRYSEAIGHGGAGLLPVFGPIAADIGEQIGTGDIAGGVGRTIGLIAPVAAAGPVARTARRVAPTLQKTAEAQVMKALGPTKERFKAMAEKRAPEVLRRRLGGSRETLKTQTGAKVREVGQQIDDLLQRKGGQLINPQPVIDALEQAKAEFQTTRRVPLADALKDGLERTPGARIVGETVELPVVFESRATTQLSKLQDVLRELGPEARVDQIVAIRRAWDKVIADAGGFQHRAPGAIGQPLKDISEAAAKRQATTAIRKLLDAEVPDLSAINKEFAFWKDLDSILRQTLQRTHPQGPGLSGIVREAAGTAAGAVIGGAAGGPFGAGAGAIATGALAKSAHQVFTSPRWRLVSARTRHTLAEALASGNTERISHALGRAAVVTSAGAQTTSPSESRSRTTAPRLITP